MTDLAATVLVPTHEHSELLPYAARSALRQTVADLELFIVGDGVEDDTREVVARLEAEDDRVRFFDMPKGERLGEAYRGPILQQARGGVVCYLSDDDLWLSDHVETMTAALAEADFASATTLCYRSEDELDVLVLVLTMPFYRELLLSGHSRIPLSAGAHTMAMYRRLPYGWRTTPAGIPTDRYMWH
jgi:GalNAc5-diNAcBac-PP-undecaprenol beta-1,3-glucosyltransferase